MELGENKAKEKIVITFFTEKLKTVKPLSAE